MLDKELLIKVESLPTDDIEALVYKLLLDNKLSYAALSSKYVKFLEAKALDQKDKLYEAESCIMEHLLTKKTKTDIYVPRCTQEKNAIQRSLYFLNQEGHQNTIYLNKQFQYAEDKAKELSWYEKQRSLYDLRNALR